jgi:CheY-like chemotaxis protein
MLLRNQGHRLLEADNDMGGLALVRSQPPDLIIADVLMPVLDGYEFVCQLRADPSRERTPVIFYTANYLGREARGTLP